MDAIFVPRWRMFVSANTRPAISDELVWNTPFTAQVIHRADKLGQEFLDGFGAEHRPDLAPLFVVDGLDDNVGLPFEDRVPERDLVRPNQHSLHPGLLVSACRAVWACIVALFPKAVDHSGTDTAPQHPPETGNVNEISAQAEAA